MATLQRANVGKAKIMHYKNHANLKDPDFHQFSKSKFHSDIPCDKSNY